jgi:hypothetical protein
MGRPCFGDGKDVGENPWQPGHLPLGRAGKHTLHVDAEMESGLGHWAETQRIAFCRGRTCQAL